MLTFFDIKIDFNVMGVCFHFALESCFKPNPTKSEVHAERAS